MHGLRLVAPIMIVLAFSAPALAQPAPPLTEEPVPPIPGEPPAQPLQPGDAFGLEVALPTRMMVYVEGKSAWSDAYATLRGALGRLHAYADKQSIKPSGPALVIYTATSDKGFSFRAALPVAAAPAEKPPDGIAAGAAPSGRALEFVHRGAFDAMGSTYEAITEYLDEHNLDATEPFIEEYVSDPLQTAEDKLIVNIYVPVK